LWPVLDELRRDHEQIAEALDRLKVVDTMGVGGEEEAVGERGGTPAEAYDQIKAADHAIVDRHAVRGGRLLVLSTARKVVDQVVFRNFFVVCVILQETQSSRGQGVPWSFSMFSLRVRSRRYRSAHSWSGQLDTTLPRPVR
jgi:hypothetical protein